MAEDPPLNRATGACWWSAEADSWRDMPAPRRYPTDLTDEQWDLIKDLVPSPKPGGRHEMHSRREIVNAILYHSRTGCSWRMLPKDLPPWETVYWYFAAWRDDGTLEPLHEALRERVRRAR